jgi:hypothetical protein
MLVLHLIMCLAVRRRYSHTTRHGKSHGALPPPLETGKKGAMPEPAEGAISILVIIIKENREVSLEVPYLYRDTVRTSPSSRLTPQQMANTARTSLQREA